MTTMRPSSPDAGTDATMIIPAIRDDATQVLRAVPADDATAVIPRIVDEPAPVEPRSVVPPLSERKDFDFTGIIGHTRAYGTEPGAPGYQGKHSDLIPLTEGSPVRAVVRTIGEIMITCGLILLLFASYEIWGKAAIVSSHQHDLDSQLEQEWAAAPSAIAPSSDPAASVSPAPPPGPPPPPPGGSIGRLYIPKLSKYWVVVEGITPSDIAYAPGHYPQTALPGQIGNFSVAGHRSPAIFWDLDRMRPGDAIVVETRDVFYIYRVTGSEIVNPTAIEVLAPVPDKPGVAPTVPMLTLTTCDPKWDNYHRLIVHAQLQRSQNRSDGRPVELQE